MTGGPLGRIGFAAGLNRFGEAVAVRTDAGEAVSYAELARRADAFASRLGDTRRLLLIETRNAIEPLIAYLGALRGGHAVILAAAGSTAKDSRLLRDFRPDAHFHETGGDWTLDLADQPPHHLHPELAVLLSTSGSTGATKLVRLSAGAVQANAAAIADYLGIRADDRAVTMLPFHYSYGLSVVNSHLLAGATLLLTDQSVTEPGFRDFFERERATSFAGVPYSFDLLDRTGFFERAHPDLRYFTQAGGRLPPDKIVRYDRWARAHGVRFFVMYGQTEATARMAYMPPEWLCNYPDHIGIAIPGGELRLIDEEGRAVSAPGASGELVYSGPNLMMGYAESADDLARGAEIEALHTGDLATINAEGFYRIVGRKSRFCKPFGLRVSLDEVESMLAGAGIAAAATGNDELIAVCVPDADQAAAARSVIGERMDLPADLFEIVAIDPVPRLASGKVDYPAILKAGEAERAARQTEDGGTASGIAHIYAASFRRADPAPEDSFTSLGGDSLSYVTVSLEIERVLGHLPDHWERMSIAELQALERARSDPEEGGRWLKRIDTEIIVRALAIIAVVINHASDIPIGGGADALLLLAGYNLARFQHKRMINNEFALVLWSFFKRIIIPYYVLLLAYALLWKGVDWPSFLLVSNFEGRFRNLLEPYWFLEALLQCMLIIGGLFLIPAVRRFSAEKPIAMGFSLLAGAMLLRVATHLLWPHGPPGNRTPDAVFYLFALGWCLNFVRGNGPKIAISLIVLALAALNMGLVGIDQYWTAWRLDVGLHRSLWLIAATLATIWIPRVSIPAVLHPVIATVAAASFYIYLTHGIPVHIQLHVFKFESAPLAVITSLLLGILLWRIMQRISLPSLSFWTAAPRKM